MKLLYICLLILVVTESKRILFTRHGQRSPTKYTETKRLRWYPYQAGDLTRNGVEFLIQRGQTLSKLFEIYDSEGNCDPYLMEIVSSPKQRTIMSTFSLIKGLCPSNFKEISIIFIETYLKQYSKELKDLTALMAHDYQDTFQISNNTRTFEMENDLLFHGHSGEECPVVEFAQQSIINSQGYKDKETYFRGFKEFFEVLEIIKLNNADDYKKNPELYSLDHYPFKKFKSFFGDYKCEWAQQLDVPVFTEEQYHLLNEVAQYIFYEVKNGHEVQKKAAASETFKWIKNALNNETIQLHWYSAHDSNMVAILSIIIEHELRSTMGYDLLPPFGSDLQWVIIDDMVTVILNGQTLQTKFCKEYQCDKSQVIQFLDRYIVHDMDHFCSQEFEDVLY